MITDPTDKPRTRKRRDLPPDVRIEPYMLSRENAAAYLAQIGLTTLDKLLASGKLTARQLSDGKVGYLRHELEQFADALPKVKPGRRKAQGETQGA